jgi:UDP-glucose 4-epimerase
MGSSLVEALVDLNAHVTIIDPLIEGLGGNLFNIRRVSEMVKVTHKDVRDAEATHRLIGQSDLIFHFAGQGSHSRSMDSPEFDIDLNIRSTLGVLEAVRKAKTNPRMIYAGTRGQIGQVTREVDESYPELPTSIYGVNKSAAEKYCFVYARHYAIQVVSMRFTNVFGPRHQMKRPDQGVLNWFIRLALENKTLEVWGGKQKRDFLYIDDATDASLKAGIENRAVGECFYVCSGRRISLISAVRLIVKTAGAGRYIVKRYPEKEKGYEVGDVLLSNKKARRYLGWRPSIEFDEGIRRTVQFYRTNLRFYV